MFSLNHFIQAYNSTTAMDKVYLENLPNKKGMIGGSFTKYHLRLW